MAMKHDPIVAVSGGFDPVHVGHIEMFKEAKKHGKVVVILNSDEWLERKKGRAFMRLEDRIKILQSIKYIDAVFPWHGEENDVSGALEILRPDIFANGGDRILTNTPETELCDRMGILPIFGIGGGKIRSSSELLKNYENAMGKNVENIVGQKVLGKNHTC